MLLLLRHGETKANRQGRWHGSTDGGLTRRGRHQALLTGNYLNRAVPPARIFTSPLRRCRETAAEISRLTEMEPVVIDDLREFGIGDWEGMKIADLNSKHGFVEAMKSDDGFAPPGGESLRDVSTRVVAALRELHDVDEGPILVVGHGVAFAVALSSLIDDQPAGWGRYRLANCSLTELGLSPMPYVGFVNLHFHLI